MPQKNKISHPKKTSSTSSTSKPQTTAATKSQTNNNTADVVIVCALQTPELETLLQAGKAKWERQPHSSKDPHTYHKATYKTKKGNNIKIIAGAPNQMGLSAVAVLATKMILHFRPKLVVMVGIAAGASKKKQGYGNILAASTTFDYGAGKIVEKKGEIGFQPDPEPIPIDTRLKSLLLTWTTERRELDTIYRSWPGEKPNTALELHVGPLGSGAAVVDSRQSVRSVLTHWRKLIGIEMEAYGVHRACLDTMSPPPMFACFKSICDFAQNKSDAWQKYAAYTAAEFCYRFLINEWENLHLNEPRPETQDETAPTIPAPATPAPTTLPADPHPHDVRLLTKVRALLSPGLQTFLVLHNFGTPFRHKILSPLHEMAENWVGAAHRFHDVQVQGAFERLMTAISRFVGIVNERTYADDRNADISTPRTEMDRRQGISETTIKSIRAMNDAAGALSKEIEHFENVARTRLRI
ncbi:hypothetical protein [Archangium sp. Cb G35]|uniref:5'-methylthioadenosine/S-adenosylhomocysteine nucleosidase family protein n=1 Tax=Archangium sp. Cb G35 TaxID=1920190 RepID=UPI000935C62E|nr:hypothetical protein [Archangium sp. Cb G35]